MTSRLRGPLVALTLLATVIGSIGLVVEPAAAADPGPGYDYHGDGHSHLGGYRTPDGSFGYCIDAGKSSPLGGTTIDQGLTSTVNGRSESVMRQLSYVLARYGGSGNSDTSAAVALVIWGLADPGDHEARGGDGFVITRAPAGSRAAILALANRIRAEARAYRPPAPGEGQLMLQVDGSTPTHGSLDVLLEPGAAIGTVTLTNAVFTDTGLSTREDVLDGAHLEIDAVTPVGQYEYDVAATGTFLAGTYPDGTVHVWATAGAQTLASAGTLVPVSFEASASLRVQIPRPTPPVRDLPRVAG